MNAQVIFQNLNPLTFVMERNVRAKQSDGVRELKEPMEDKRVGRKQEAKLLRALQKQWLNSGETKKFNILTLKYKKEMMHYDAYALQMLR